MTDSQKTEGIVRDYLNNLATPSGAEADGKILCGVLTAMNEARSQHTVPTNGIPWSAIVTSKAGKLAAVVAVVAIVLSFTVFDVLTQPAWALEDAIEALKDLKAAHIVGAFAGETVKIWVRADVSKSQSSTMIVRSSHGAVTWVRDGSTYHYEPGQDTVYFENAITLGFSDWLGPDLLRMFSMAEDAQTLRGKDPATGRDRITLLCSIGDMHGPQSWIMEFDAASKLPIAFKQWANLDRSGPPAFEAFKITYYEDIADSLFDVQIPGNPTYVERPLTIQEAFIDMLSNPAHGMPTEGLDQQQACERILRTGFQAVIDEDLETLKKLSPFCASLGDELLRAAVFRTGREDRVTEILEIGEICKTGHTQLGPIVAVPVQVRRKDGVKVEEKTIVQFRNIAGVPSCVIYGPYGLPRDIE